MAKVYAPNKDYTGVSATVAFYKGVGETNDKGLIAWFERQGYTIEQQADVLPTPSPKALSEMGVDELIAYADEKGIDIGKATSQNGILEKIQEAEQVGGVDGK